MFAIKFLNERELATEVSLVMHVFFRRMVAKKLRSKCKENDICPVPDIYGGTCTSCRLNKCIRSVNQQSKVKSCKLFRWNFPSTHSAKIINLLYKNNDNSNWSKCPEKFPLVLMGGRAEGLACADPGATPPEFLGFFLKKTKSA